jgi:hypothetical protein
MEEMKNMKNLGAADVKQLIKRPPAKITFNGLTGGKYHE